MEVLTAPDAKKTEQTIAVWRDPQGWGRRDVFLSFTVVYTSADGRGRWTDGTIDFFVPNKPEDLLNYVLSFTTQWVREHWLRVEVHLPNRGAYGRLESGYVGDKGILLATRKPVVG